MVNLQNEQQRQYTTDDAAAVGIDNSPTPFPTLKAPSQQPLRSTPPRLTSVFASDFYLDPTVGKGTMTINFSTDNLQQDSSSSLPATPVASQRVLPQSIQPSQKLEAATPPPSMMRLASAATQHTNLSSYGAVDNDNHKHYQQQQAAETETEQSPASFVSQQQQQSSEQQQVQSHQMYSQQQQQQQQQQNYHQHNHVHHSSQQQQLYQSQQHDFHYDHPDFHDPYRPLTQHPDHYYYNQHQNNNNNRNASSPSPTNFRRRRRISFCDLFCALCSETLTRSFCYGAIDGLLTGSGLLGAFVGMHLPIFENTTTRLFLLALTASACFADSVCMAIGHLWTSHVMAISQTQERNQARLSLLREKADAKGQLVDMLLQKGMLKIDAMSLADTLEGYPDLFVNALIGEPLAGVETLGQLDVDHDHGTGVGIGSNRFGDDESDLFYSARSQQLQQQHHHHHQPSSSDHSIVATTGEAGHESLFMLLGFILFAMAPSLLVEGVARFSDTENESSSYTFSSPTLVFLLGLSSIMWILGVWKSRFVDHCNWLLFAIETVVLLWLCMACAYFVGSVLQRVLLEHGAWQVTELSASKITTKAAVPHIAAHGQ